MPIADPTTVPGPPTPPIPALEQQGAQSATPAGATGAPTGPTGSGPLFNPVRPPAPSTTTNVQAAANAAPKLDPKSTVAVSRTSSNTGEVAANAQIVQAFNESSKFADLLKSANARTQLAFWDTASKPLRDMLDAAGYEPPDAPPKREAKEPNRGFWGGLWHDVTHELDNARHGAAFAGSHAIHTLYEGATKVANVGVGPIEHAVRAGIDLADVNDTAYGQGKESMWTDLHALVSPDQWIQAWHATQHGASSFQPQVVRYLQTKLDPFQLQIAKYLAGGLSLTQVLSKVPAKRRGEAYSLIETNTDLQDGVKLLSDSHLTLGQAVFGGLSPAEEEKMFGSGAELYNAAAKGITLAGEAASGPVGKALAVGSGALTIKQALNPNAIEPTISPFGIQIHPLSGIADGLVDWYDSPFVWGTQVRAANVARRFAILDALGNARDARALYQIDPAVRRGMDMIASTFTSEGGRNIAAVMKRFPQLTPMADDLEAHYNDIAEATRAGHGGAAVAEVFAENQAMLSLARGRAGMFYHGSTLFPHLTLPQIGLSEVLSKAEGLNLDRLSPRQVFRSVFGQGAEEAGIADAENAPGPSARFMRRATTLTPETDTITLSSPDRGKTLDRFARMFLPERKAQQAVNGFMAIPTTDEGRQRAFVVGLMDDLFRAAGLDKTTDGLAYIEDWHRRAEAQMIAGEHYSYGRNAFYQAAHMGDEMGREHALIPSQLSHEMAIPDFADLWKLSKKSWWVNAIGGHLSPEAMDRFMSSVWKPMLLLRLGFGVRVAGEELLGKVLRDGLAGVTQSRIAASTLKIQSPAQRDLQISRRVYEALTSHVPLAAQKAIKTTADWAAMIFGFHAIRWLKQAGLAFSAQDIQDAARWWADNGRYEGPLSESIDALTQHTGGIVDDEHGVVESVRKRWGATEGVYMRPNGAVASVGPLDSNAYEHLHYALSGLTHDDVTRAVARALPHGEDAQVAAALEWIQNPENEDVVKRFTVHSQTPDGRLVETGEVGQERADQEWAQRIVNHANHYLMTPDRAPIEVDVTHGDGSMSRTKLYNQIAAGRVPATSDLESIPREHLPDEIVARQLVPSTEGRWQRFIDGGMRQMVGRPLNWLSRQPIFLHNFSKAFREARDLVKSLGIKDAGDKLAGDIASERAWRETLPYIHNPRVRSQLSIITRDLAPFWFAQEQFFKRWVRTFATYPAAFRRAELLMNGLRASGFVQKDTYGQDAFIYPGSGFVNEFLGKAFGGSLVVPNQFSSEISQLNPSFGSNGLQVFPSFGPFVTIPLRTIDALFPSLDPYVLKMLGPQAPKPDHQQSLAVQLLSALVDETTPTVAQRLIQVGESTNPSDPFYSSMKASAAIAAAQYLEAEGHGPPASEDPAEIDKWYQRLENWAQTMMALRVAFGFAAPGAPEFNIGNTELGKELTALTATMPYDQAVAAFLKVHPDATAYTVFASTTGQVGQSGAFVPSTKAALAFIEQHLVDFKNPRYAAAAPWLFPISTGKGPFSDQAYQLELAINLRSRRDFGDWWQEVRYQEGANIYFPVENAVKAAEAKDPAMKQSLQHEFDGWAREFKAAHPIFASMLDEPTATNRRNEVMTAMENMLADGKMPDTPQARHIAFLMAGFEEVQAAYNRTQGETAYSSEHTMAKKVYISWGDEVVKTYPDAAGFWNSVLAKVVPG